jgi:hypothetical protein
MVNRGIEWAMLDDDTRIDIGWNMDFMLASTYQKGILTGTPDDADYCTIQDVQLEAADTELDSSAVEGFVYSTKCTFLATSKIAMGAPTMQLTAADSLKFQLQWAEWEAGALTAKTQLVASDVTPLFLGAVGTGEWPNPMASYEVKGTADSDIDPTFCNAAAAQPLTDFEPTTDGYAASPGKIQWWPSQAGLGLLTAVSTMDYMQLKSEYDTYNSMANSYNTEKSSYETLKTAYNTALADETTRQADFFKAMFEPAVEIPERPCQPTRPDAFMGVSFMNEADSSDPDADAKKDDMVGTFNQNDGVRAFAASFKLGYQLPNVDDATWAEGAGHTYGLLGEGEAQYADGVLAFQWDNTDIEKKAHYMMVSLLPYTTGFTELASDKLITISWKNAVFDTSMASISKPSQPDDTSAPDAVGAKALAASAVALAAVAASLF